MPERDSPPRRRTIFPACPAPHPPPPYPHDRLADRLFLFAPRRRSRPHQHRQDPSRGRAHARPCDRHDRPAAAGCWRARSTTASSRRGARATSRWSPAKKRSCRCRRATGSARSRRCRSTARSSSSPSTRSSSAPTPSAATSSPTACCTRAGMSETMLLGAATAAPLIRRLCPEFDHPVARPLLATDLRRLEEAHPPAAAQRHRRLLRRRRLRHRRADPPPSRRRGGGDGLAVARAPATPRSPSSSRAKSISSSPPTRSAWASTWTSTTSPSPRCASSTAAACAGCITQEIGQIAGRAGRYRRDGTFGVTGDAPEMDADVVAAVEGHAFAPLTAAEWRNARLDFSSLAGLMRSLAAPPPTAGPQALRREPGRDDAAPARRRRDSSSAAAATAPTSSGCGTSARRPTSARPRRRSTRG